MRRIDELHLEHPFAGSRMLRDMLKAEGRHVGSRHVATLMRRVEAIYRRPNTSKPAPGHKIYPYLLRNLAVTRPNQVWASDITYVPMARGFVYLVAIVDWFSRKVLAWRLSITLSADFCVEALEEALARHGNPEVFNTDQGSQFTSTDFTKVLKDAEICDQCLRRAALADGQIRGSLSACLRRCHASQSFDRPVSELQQRQEAAFVAWRANSRSGIHQPADANPGGGLKWAAKPLKNAREGVQTNRATSLVVQRVRDRRFGNPLRASALSQAGIEALRHAQGAHGWKQVCSHPPAT